MKTGLRAVLQPSSPLNNEGVMSMELLQICYLLRLVLLMVMAMVLLTVQVLLTVLVLMIVLQTPRNLLLYGLDCDVCTPKNTILLHITLLLICNEECVRFTYSSYCLKSKTKV